MLDKPAAAAQSQSPNKRRCSTQEVARRNIKKKMARDIDVEWRAKVLKVARDIDVESGAQYRCSKWRAKVFKVARESGLIWCGLYLSRED